MEGREGKEREGEGKKDKGVIGGGTGGGGKEGESVKIVKPRVRNVASPPLPRLLVQCQSWVADFFVFSTIFGE